MHLENALAHYYPELKQAINMLRRRSGDGEPEDFTPDIKLPELTSQMRDYLAASTLAHMPLGRYKGHDMSLLNLALNPGTNTTKTFASLTIVARAVRFIQDTGQHVTIVTPSSANKAVALRDAVLRAIKAGLVGADQLNIVSVVPVGAAYKLRASELSTDPFLRVRNPVGIYTGTVPETVKTITRNVVDERRDTVERLAKTNLWYTLRLENYIVADAVRALFEADFFPPGRDRFRLHAHAVSSAYGLLGHAHGRTMLGGREAGLPSRYFLVQHLGAPDMVTHLLGDLPSAPAYAYEEDSGRYTQRDSPHFPFTTYDPEEVLDPTFYTRHPATAPQMTALIRAQGGGGVVVSLAECLERYGLVRSLLSAAGVPVPANPTRVQEWSLVMAMTGVLNAIDRGLVPEDDIVVHGSGIYSHGDFEQLGTGNLSRTADADALHELLLRATVQ